MFKEWVKACLGQCIGREKVRHRVIGVGSLQAFKRSFLGPDVPWPVSLGTVKPNNIVS
jgi:hypothetical protein